MKKHLFKIIDKLVVLALVLTGCEPGGGMCEYGSPHANFRLKGTITAPDNKPVKGIQVKGAYKDSTGVHHNDYYPQVLTDEKGQYSLNTVANALIVEDIDGTENGGLFATDTIEVPPFTSADSIPDTNEDNWDWYGNFEKTVNIQLKPAESKENE